MAQSSNDVKLTFDNKAIVGWDSVRITRGIERCPNDFGLSLTQRVGEDLSTVDVRPGTPCKLYIGDALVITGYVDRYTPSITETTHSIKITGRGKCQDLVDCSAIYEQGAFINMTLPQIAAALAKKFDIGLNWTSGLDEVLPSAALMYGETPMQIIDRIAKYEKVLVYESENGDLNLLRTYLGKMGTGFKEGVNVQAASIEYSMDGRYSEYRGFYQPIDTFGDVPGHFASMNASDPVKDPGVPRYRPRILIAEHGDALQRVLRDRMLWECNRRIGRSSILRVTTDSWRDGNGRLWAPNFSVPLHLPRLHISSADWLIGEVTYLIDNTGGTRAELTIMPPGAYAVVPTVYVPTQLTDWKQPDPPKVK